MYHLAASQGSKRFLGLTEYLELLWTNLLVKKRNFIEFTRVAAKYYPDSHFMRIDQSLLRQYSFKSPYRISRDFLRSQGEEEIYAYGETPLTTIDLIASKCQLRSTDTLFELGCGRGRACFWLNEFVGCKVVGIDFVPSFIQKAEYVRAKYRIKQISFRCEDILKTDLAGATVIYLYGTCYDDPFIEKLIKKFVKLPPGTKIITVSYPLRDYPGGQTFEVMNRFEAPFTWGAGEVYLQMRT